MHIEQFSDISILIVTIIVMIFGALWYSSSFFGPRWSRLSGVDLEDPTVDARLRKKAGLLYFRTFLSTIVMATLLNTLMIFLGADTWQQGVVLGMSLWIGFVATTSLINYSFSERPLALWMIDGGYHLASLMMMGAILSI